MVSEYRYCIGKQEIDISDIRQLLAETKIVAEKNDIPFPQADIFPRIVDLLGRLYNANEPLSKDEITLIYAFNERQTGYYVSATQYLGLVTRKYIKNQGVTFFLNPKGQSIMSQHPQRRKLELAKCILCDKVFNESLHIHLNQGQSPVLQDIIQIIKDQSVRNANYSGSVLKRRAQTVKGWIDWIVDLTRI